MQYSKITNDSFSIFSNKIWPEEEVNSNISTPKSPQTPSFSSQPPSRERSDSGIQHSGIEEETTTDWTPEIPFENVSKYWKTNNKVNIRKFKNV